MSSLAATHLVGSGYKIPTTVEGRAKDLVNPASGLANDYLNIFNELVMLVEQLPTMPEFMEDIGRWRPVSYVDYFSHSSLPGSQSALDAYHELETNFREEFDALVAELDDIATATVTALRRHDHADAQALEKLCHRAGASMRATLGRATRIVNYGERRSRESGQHKADRLMSKSRL